LIWSLSGMVSHQLSLFNGQQGPKVSMRGTCRALHARGG
jgi:hypothetical protein